MNEALEDLKPMIDLLMRAQKRRCQHFTTVIQTRT